MKHTKPDPELLRHLNNRNVIELDGPAGLLLRPFETEDHAAIVDILLNPRVWEQGFGDGFTARPLSISEAYRFLYQEILTPDRHVFALDVGGQAIGICSYFQPEPENARVEVGKLLLAEAYWGQGYMGAALQGLVRNAFGVGYHRVSAEADELNGRSVRTLTHAGFSLEGIRRHSSFHADGSRRDICIFSITLDDEEVLRRLKITPPNY